MPLAAALYARNACGDSVIHGWHCDCDDCTGNAFDFKVQRDSTVDGEVISRVFDDWDEAIDAMLTLQEAAIEADAEPGLSAGLHVHVAQPRQDLHRGRAFLAFMAWEEALIAIAAGRFPYLRDMNRTVNGDMRAWLYASGTTTRQGAPRWIANALAQARDGDSARAIDLYLGHWGNDRHSHLSVNTRFSTWEFRIWNSTRSAWRMELACRMSVAFRSTNFVDCLIAFDGEPRDRTPEALRDIIATEWQGDDRLAVLLDRQLAYRPRASEAPQRFLVA